MTAPPDGPEAPQPDLKDWTWAIHDVCPDCGFDPASVRREDVPARTRQYVAILRTPLRHEDAGVRPSPRVWSPLEYGCHARDVCVLFDRRLALMLAEDDPQFDNWDQDATALAEKYWEQDPRTVEAQLDKAADTVAASFGAVVGEQWERRGRRSDGSSFTVDTFARYFLHDLAHHAWDIAKLASASVPAEVTSPR